MVNVRQPLAAVSRYRMQLTLEPDRAPMGIKGDDLETIAMRLLVPAIVAALSLAGAASAQSLADNPPKTTTICLDPTGRNLPAHCRAEASRLEAREDICLCPAGTDRVMASVCPTGVHPPGESAAFYRARKAAVQHGSVVGAVYNGQPMCVPPRTALNP